MSDRINAVGGSIILAWFLIGWMNFLPPVWHVIDLYLHREDLIERHNLRIPIQGLRPLKLFRISLQVLWLVTSTPIVAAVFVLNAYYTNSLSSIFFLVPSLDVVFFTVMILVNIAIVVMIVWVIRRVRGRRKTMDTDNFDPSSRAFRGGGDEDGDATVDDEDDNVVKALDPSATGGSFGYQGHGASHLTSHLF